MELVSRSGLLIVLLALAACGGGGGNGGAGPIGTAPNPPGGGNPPPSGGGNNGYAPGVFAARSTFADQCVAPRAGTSDRSGTAFTEKMFLRSWTNELYLWYSEVPDRNPDGYTVASYFDSLMTPQVTPSGRAKDQFHFTYPTDVWEALSEAGIEVGYGTQWLIFEDQFSREIIAAFVEPGTPAANAGLSRGVEVLTADGVNVSNANTDATIATLNAAFFPAEAGESHTFRVRELSGAERDVTMTSVEVERQPVLVSSVIPYGGVQIGYILFNDHIATAESALIAAINQLNAANVQDLVLDLRYNGGGYLDIASQLSYMIAGGSRTTGQPFERLVFNDKHPNTNPITGQPLEPTPFHTRTLGFDTTANQSLPTLDLDRVYVITGENTCSASESIINGLRGVGVQVYQIGSTTCGKPYGFYPQDNCSTTYFSIQFKGENAQGFGDYADGFSPENSGDVGTEPVDGCAVADDFSRQLGDPTEARLRAALEFRESNNLQCPAPSSFAPGTQLSTKQQLIEADGVMFRSPARENRILRN
jgi:hypothetical protein